MLTSSREERDLIETYQLGVNAYVVKPVGFHDFVEAVSKLGLFWALINQPPPLPAARVLLNRGGRRRETCRPPIPRRCAVPSSGSRASRRG